MYVQWYMSLSSRSLTQIYLSQYVMFTYFQYLYVIIKLIFAWLVNCRLASILEQILKLLMNMSHFASQLASELSNK